MYTRLHSRDDYGFTLIELLIVVVVLGILAGIVLLAVPKFQSGGKTSAAIRGAVVAGATGKESRLLRPHRR